MRRQLALIAVCLAFGAGCWAFLLHGVWLALLAARESARTASCGAQMRQVQLASHVYASDYDEHLPPSTPRCTWRARQVDYVKNVAIYRCPSDASADDAQRRGLDSGGLPSSYMANVNLYQPGAGASLKTVKRPNQTVLQCEFEPGPHGPLPAQYHHQAAESHQWDSYAAGTLTATTALSQLPGGSRPARHRGCVTVSFVDGHVSLLPVQALRPAGTDGDGLFATR